MKIAFTLLALSVAGCATVRGTAREQPLKVMSYNIQYGNEGLDSVIAAQKASFHACKNAGRTDCAFDLDLWSILTPQILAAFAALGIMALIPVIVRHWRRRTPDAAVAKPSTATAKHPNA